MADETHKIALELVLEGQQQINEGLKKTVKDTKTFGSVNAAMEKVSLRHTKEREKLDKKINDPRKRKKGLTDEQQSNKYLKERVALLRKQNKEVDSLLNKMQRMADGQDPSDPRKDPRGRKKEGLGRGMRRWAGGAALSVAGAGIGMMASQIRQGYAQYNQYGMGLMGLAGTDSTAAGTNRLLGQGTKLGYDKIQGVQQARAVALATGRTEGTTSAQTLTRSTTLDMGQATGLMGLLTQAGQGFGGKAGTTGNKQLQKIISLGFSSGIDKARLPEFIKGATGVIKAQAARQGGNIDAAGYAAVLQAMGASGSTGLQGDRGAAVFQRLNEAIVNPGGGEAGQAMMLQAFGFGKPGGSSSYYEALKQQEQGATAQNVKAVFGEFGAQKGGGEAQILALRTTLGLSITQLEELRGVVETMEGPARDKKLDEILEKAKPADERAADSMNELGEIAKQNAIVTNHALTVGKEAKDAIIKMQLAINKLVTELLPTAITVLNVIAKLVQGIANFVGGGMGGTDLDYEVFGFQKQTDRQGGVTTNLPGGLGPQFDPAYLHGGQQYNKVERQAISDIISKNQGLEIAYGGRNRANNPADDRKWLNKNFGEGGLFYDQFQAVVNASERNADAAEKMAEEAKTVASAGKEAVPYFISNK